MDVPTGLIGELGSHLKGRLIVPGDAEYDPARTLFYGGFDLHPAVIARVKDAGDAALVIRAARTYRLELAVRSGGHSVAGHSGTENGIVLDLSEMKALQVDAEKKTMWAETGLTAGECMTAAVRYGLAPVFGDTASVGIGGITLGGGVGYLVRKHGLTIDNLLAADLVTADGRLLHVDADREPDLFWAIRGGGGNFGVATRFLFRLHPLSDIYGGMLVLPAAPEVISGFVSLAEAAPEGLSAIANVMKAPPMPFLPPELHGKLVVMAMIVYAGDPSAGPAAVRPFRELAAPHADMVRPMKYQEIFAGEGGGYHPVAASRTLFAESISSRTAGEILNRLRSSTASMAVTQLRVLGGAMARVPADATAFCHRLSRIMVNVAALYQNPGDKGMHEKWAADFASALTQGDHGAYVNFLGEDGAERIRAAYPGKTWDRLRRIKTVYDPENLFRLNQNIPPEQGSGSPESAS